MKNQKGFMKGTMRTLSRKQLERQDLVDNEIYELIQKLLPSAKKRIEWDIEIIGAVRDAIQSEVVGRKAMSEVQFYPYIRI